MDKPKQTQAQARAAAEEARQASERALQRCSVADAQEQDGTHRKTQKQITTQVIQTQTLVSQVLAERTVYRKEKDLDAQDATADSCGQA